MSIRNRKINWVFWVLGGARLKCATTGRRSPTVPPSRASLDPPAQRNILPQDPTLCERLCFVVATESSCRQSKWWKLEIIPSRNAELSAGFVVPLGRPPIPSFDGSNLHSVSAPSFHSKFWESPQSNCRVLEPTGSNRINCSAFPSRPARIVP